MTWEPTEWQAAEQKGDDSRLVTIRRMRSPYYEGTRYAVRIRGCVLSVDGDWVYEPMPSERDDAFYERCRFKSFEAAQKAAEMAIRQEAAEKGATHE